MVSYESSSGTATIVTSCFQLKFRYQEDHWRHEVVSEGDTASIPRLSSVEATTPQTDHGRVISPTYQQIHLDRTESGVVRALLVGQAGPHHFSASFEVEEDPSGASVAVDVADRCHSPVLALAATYAVERSPGSWGRIAVTGSTDEDQTNLVLDAANPVCHLIFSVDPPGHHQLHEDSHGRIQAQALANVDLNNQTHRFRYHWRWVKDPRPPVWDKIA